MKKYNHLQQWWITELKEKRQIFKTRYFQETCGEMKPAFFIPFMDSVALKERTDQMKHIHMREWKTK